MEEAKKFFSLDNDDEEESISININDNKSSPWYTFSINSNEKCYFNNIIKNAILGLSGGEKIGTLCIEKDDEFECAIIPDNNECVKEIYSQYGKSPFKAILHIECETIPTLITCSAKVLNI